MSLIPKNIYKTAPSLHPKLKKLYLNTELQNPGWKIKFYNDKDCINFLKNEFSKDNLDLRKKVLKSYNKLIPSAYKADLWRLCVIYEYGGVYSDASQIFKIPIDQIIDTTKEFCIIKDRDGKKQGAGANANLQGLQIALFSSVKKHPFLLKYIENINMNVTNLNYRMSSLDVTGPHAAYRVAKENNFLNKIKIVGQQMAINIYINNDGKEIVKKANFHRDVVYGGRRDQHYDSLWRKKKIYNISNENKSQKKINTPLVKKQTNINENKSQKKINFFFKKQTIIKKKNKIRRINNLNYNKNNKLIGYDDSTNHLFSYLKRK
jgi:hypothetical protein